jgi:hypothetical protein
MNYQKHYDRLINRSPKNKPSSGYYEKHRIIPGCIGGTYDNENVVWLTAEEHFVAHQLLYKIYKLPKLLYAINMMTIHNTENRVNNKKYSWLRKKFSQNHPNKTKCGKKILSESMYNYYKSIEYKTKSDKLKIKYREERECACGCGQTFTVYKKQDKKYINNSHANRNRNYSSVSSSMRNNLAKLSFEENKERVNKSMGTCDHKLRGEKISKSKKGKKTNQQEIVGKRYAEMSQTDFDMFLKNRNPKMHNRMIKLRERFM